MDNYEMGWSVDLSVLQHLFKTRISMMYLRVV